MKMLIKHTAGEWVVTNGLQVWHSGHNTVESPRICTLQNAADPVRQISYAEMRANAYLISYAPTMYAALHQIATYDPAKWDAVVLGNIARAPLINLGNIIGD